MEFQKTWDENSKCKKVTKRDEIWTKIFSEKRLRDYLGGHCPNVVAYQTWVGSVDNFSVEKHYKFDIKQTTDRQDTRQIRDIFIAVSES